MSSSATIHFRSVLLGAFLVVVTSGCSMQRIAAVKMADALASTGTTFASDDDPELVGEALPFGLKLMESVLASATEHRELLVATSRGFTQYAYGWVAQRADELEATDVSESLRHRRRARALYLRARDYGLRAIAVRRPAIAEQLSVDPRVALMQARREDVPALYWTAAAWGLAIAVSKDDPELVADLPIVTALVERASRLDPDFEAGALEIFRMNLEASNPAGADAFARAHVHFRRAVEVSSGRSASAFVAYAETVAVAQQRRSEFEALLREALAIDPDVRPEWRLQNLMAQRRAAWLLSRVDELFLDEEPEGAQP